MKLWKELSIKMKLLNESWNIKYKWIKIEFCYISAAIWKTKNWIKLINKLSIKMKLLNQNRNIEYK